MIKTILSVLLLAAAICHPAGSQEKRSILAVMDFVPSGVSESEAILFTDYVLSAVVKAEKYTVIDRAQRAGLLKEVEFSLADCSDERCQLEVGRMLSAQQLVVGSVGKFGENYILNMKLLNVETAMTANAVSGAYGSLGELLKDTEQLTGRLLGTGMSKVPAPVETQVNTEVKEPLEPVRLPTGTYRVPEKSIQADGDTRDWEGVPAAFNEKPGRSKNKALELKSLRTAMDSAYGYLLIELYSASWPADSTVNLTIDFTSDGSVAWKRDGRADIDFNISPSAVRAWKTETDTKKRGADYGLGAWKVKAKENVLEAAIPLKYLNKIRKVEYFNATHFDLWLQNPQRHCQSGDIPPYNFENGVLAGRSGQSGGQAQPWLGVQLDDDGEGSRVAGFSKGLVPEGQQGACVMNINLGSPAEKAGLLLGDFITKVNETPLQGSLHAVQLLRASKPGQLCRLELIRFAQRMLVQVVLGQRFGDEEPYRVESLWPGMLLTNSDAETRAKFDIASERAGVVVCELSAVSSPAAVAGFKAGDLIVEIDRQPIAGMRDFFSAMNGAAGAFISILLERQGELVVLFLPNRME